MDTISLLLGGFASVLTPALLLYCLVGCLLGMLTGVLPGFGPAAAASLLLPLTFVLDPAGSIIMMLGIYYGAMYGGTITSVLLKVPGEAASVVTCIDGYQMALKGQAGKALAISAVGSFVGGVIALFGMLFATSLARYAITIGPLDLFGLSVLALALVAGLAGRSMTKAWISAGIGMFIGMVGLDPVYGTERFTFDNLTLTGGLSFIAVIMGFFGVSEILTRISKPQETLAIPKVGSTRLSWSDIRQSLGSMGRGTVIGFLFGLIPGSPVVAASFTSWVTEKRLSKTPEKFGKGAIQGVAGPETSNNALGISSMIPLLSFGIPASPTMAIVLGAFLIQGIQPGPLMFRDHPDVGWAIIAGLFVANVMLVVLSLPLVRMWASILKVPQGILYPVTLGLMFIGAYAVNNSMFDVAVMWIAGLLGFFLRRIDVPLAPAALTIVLGPIIENNLRTALSLQSGIEGLVASPIANVCYVLIALVFIIRPFLKSRATRFLTSETKGVLPNLDRTGH